MDILTAELSSLIENADTLLSAITETLWLQKEGPLFDCSPKIPFAYK